MSSPPSPQSETRAQRAARRAAARRQQQESQAASSYAAAARRSSDDSSSDSSSRSRQRRSTSRIAASVAPSGSALGEATNKTTTSSAKRSQRETASTETSRKKARGNPRPSVPPLDTSAPTVTPASAAVARQIDFGDNHSVQSDATILPEGVVNIFPSKPNAVVCNCPADINDKTVAAFEHMANYGREYGEILRNKEDRQLSEAATVLLPPSRESSTTTLTSSDSLLDDLSRPGTPSPGTVLRYRPRALNMQDGTSSLESSTEPMYRQPLITPRMRAILINWLVEVSQEYSVSQDAFHLSVTLLDMILAKGPTQQQLDEWDDDEDSPEWFLVARHEFQALGCACLWIASKMEDKMPPLQGELVYISDHSFSSLKLREFERKVCQTLAFRLHRVTPLHFINEYLRASHACPIRSCKFDHPVLRQVVQYLLELSRLSYELSFYKPSLVAAAAVFLARATVGIRETNPEHKVDAKGYWTKTLQYQTKYSVEDLKDTVWILYKYQLRAEGSNTASAFNKYRKREYQFASLKTVLRVEDLGLDSEVNHEDLEVDAQLSAVL